MTIPSQASSAPSPRTEALRGSLEQARVLAGSLPPVKKVQNSYYNKMVTCGTAISALSGLAGIYGASQSSTTGAVLGAMGVVFGTGLAIVGNQGQGLQGRRVQELNNQIGGGFLGAAESLQQVLNRPIRLPVPSLVPSPPTTTDAPSPPSSFPGSSPEAIPERDLENSAETS